MLGAWWKRGEVWIYSIPNSVAIKFDYLAIMVKVQIQLVYIRTAHLQLFPSRDMSSTGIDLHSEISFTGPFVYDGTNLLLP